MKNQKNNQPINKGRSGESTKGTSSIYENNLMTRKFIIASKTNKKMEQNHQLLTSKKF